ncbi:MAG: DNA mismatch repair endonuclease MutL [Candidatus Latescibacteria bacterium]|nr:DNA mismatch repair endonuclease MutL [bacterium]MBD3423655.1 DNA mismatch repair endonuclease MutL [Candidatus Latescibacterota bacterium]
MIAAGEVIERPVNVVKELIENSLDAGSERITVTIEKGGKRLICIEDDGSGIPVLELEAAADNFSTSKISGIDDITRVETLGFRGEALASIRAVSRLSILSRTADDHAARKVSWEGLERIDDRPAAREKGTTVTVRDLFFNLPARKKFLSSDSAETRRIAALVRRMSISFPSTSIRLLSDGNKIISYSGSSEEERVEAVLGQGNFRSMNRVEFASGDLRVKGYVSSPEISRGNRSMQHFFVNRRYVRDKVIGFALRRAYETIIPSDRYPLAILFLELPHHMVDINVHPTKSRVKFREEREVHQLIYNAVRDAAGGEKTVSFQKKVESVYRSIFPEGEKGLSQTQEAGKESDLSFRQNELDIRETDWMARESPRSLLNEKPEISRSAELYWQLHDSYIFIQIRNGLVIIDQHAAHERILYDRAKQNMEGKPPSVQSLLFPATIELSVEEYNNFEEFSDILPKMGFEAEPFGMRTIIVRGIPSGVKNWGEGSLMRDILGETGGRGYETDEMLKSYACNSAIRAGEKLTFREMESLVDQLFATEYPFTCPHGRPTMLRISRRELDSRFNRK